MIVDIFNKVQEKILNSYGWSIIDPEDPFDQTVQPGELVYFYDDEMDAWGHGIYEGWYSDFNRQHETSPYFCEAYEGIDRLVITDSVINPDNSISTRRNYILPENIFGGYEANTKVFSFTEVA